MVNNQWEYLQYSKNQVKIKPLIEKVLENYDRLWNKEKTELNQTLLIDLVEKYDEKILSLLFNNNSLKEKFFVKINKNYVFKNRDFRFFLEENKINNSYTQYKNRIGLTDGKRFLKDTPDVVLNYPYKDCILEGGQSTEKGEDIYFEYNKKVTATDEKKGYKENSYNKKQAKRKEIFFNEILAADEIDRLLDEKALVNWQRIYKGKNCGQIKEKKPTVIKRNESNTIKENLIIKGNNLLALHSLKKQFTEKVKLIYIDPPYNTGNDGFKYNDNFNHSAWLVFMKNRLEIAKELLRDDGVIFVQCDDNEQAYLKVLMDEVFGRENFVNCITIKSSTPSGVKISHADKKILKSKDYLLVFKKNKIKLKPQYELKTKWDTHYSFFIEKQNGKINKKSLVDKINQINLFQIKNIKEFDITNKLHKEFYLKYGNFICRESTHENKAILELCNSNPNEILEINGNWYIDSRMLQPISRSFNMAFDGHTLTRDISNLLCDFWYDIDFQNTQNQGGVSLTNGKKPEQLIYRIIDMTTKKNDIVLDYHLGSGTTAAVVHKMGRQYIGIEQMDYIEDITVQRLKKVIDGEQGGISKSVDWQGGGDFIYCELAKWNEQAKEKFLECKNIQELEIFFNEIVEKYFLNYNLKIKEFQETVIKEENFQKLSLDEQKQIFITMLDNNQVYVNKTEMSDKKYGISEADITWTEEFYK